MSYLVIRHKKEDNHLIGVQD